jgi:hypothetical protein
MQAHRLTKEHDQRHPRWRGVSSEHTSCRRAFVDALHIALAAVHAVEYLLTWNCSYIANAELLPRITAIIETAGFSMPFVCTPEELLGETHDQ